MEVVQIAPRELWVVAEDSWSLPIHADPYSCDAKTVTHYSVRPALHLLATPFAKLSTRFGPINQGTATTFWVIPADSLTLHAARVAGCEAKDYLRWEDKEPGKGMVGKEEIAESSEESEAFIKFFCDKACIDRPLGRYVWRAIKDGILHWLVNVQKPIDFEVFKVHPVPFRTNWKEIMLAKYPGIAPTIRKPKKMWPTLLAQIGFLQELGSTDLIAMNARPRTFTWSLEIEESKLLRDEWMRAETTRMATKKPVMYARYYESVLKRRLDDILSIFATYVDKACLPVAAVCESRVSCDPILVPVQKRKTVCPANQRPRVVTFQPYDTPRLKPGQGSDKRVETKAMALFKMPDLPHGIEDVRGPAVEGNVDRPADNGAGASGLQMLHACQGPAEWGGLLDSDEDEL